MDRTHSADDPSPLADASLAAAVVVLVVILYNWAPFHTTFGFMLLAGTWWVDAFLKKALGYTNVTAFADLSFASLIFSGSQGVDIVRSGRLGSLVAVDVVTKVFVLTVLLGFVWLGNLRMCRALESGQGAQTKYYNFAIWTISVLFALVSVSIALYVHEFRI